MVYEGLKRSIEQYSRTKLAVIEFEKRESELFSKMEKLFQPEFERLKKLLPKGYEFHTFNAGNFFNKPSILIENPTLNERELNAGEFDNLDKLLRAEFERIEREYGFGVRVTKVFHIG